MAFNEITAGPEMSDFLGLDSFDILSDMEFQTKASRDTRNSILCVQSRVRSSPSSEEDDEPDEKEDFVGDAGDVDNKGLVRQQYVSLKELQNAVNAVKEPLVLVSTERDRGRRLSALPYNALCLEMRDLFRILEGLVSRVNNRTITSQDLVIFYDWFEGFFGILTSILEVMEDILFSWLEKVGAHTLDKSLAPKRRSTKATRTKEICWDILELKVQLQKSGAGKSAKKSTLGDIVFELETEVMHLSMRILSYATTIKGQIPMLVSDNFESAECAMMEMAMYRNLKASKPGKFVLAAFTRTMETPDERFAFLHAVFVADGHKNKKGAGLKAYKKFLRMHVNLADELALSDLKITHVDASAILHPK